MADTFTTKLNLTKPEVGASADTWGTKLNGNFDTLDGLFATGPYLAVTAGGTGAGTAANARTSLGLGSMAVQSADAVAITGGTAALNSATITTTTEANFLMTDTAATADNKTWRLVVSAENFYIQACNDAFNAFGTAFSIERTGTTINAVSLASPAYVNGNLIYHAGNISSATIAETQITDGAVLARVGGNETISGSWNFTTAPKVSSLGALYWGTSGLTGGSVTLTDSTPAASGTPGNIVLVY